VPKGDPHLLNWLGNLMHGLEHSGLLKGLREKWFINNPTWLPRMK
jgi:hypothetical protein